METSQSITPGQWAGHTQAFAAIASQCSAGQVHCIKKARESAAFQKLGLTWDLYAKMSFGLSRSQADNLIRQLDRYGDPFFYISQIARIGPRAYRQIAGSIIDGRFHFDGQELEIAPENGPKIRAAIKALLGEPKPPPPPRPNHQDQIAAVLNAFLEAATAFDEARAQSCCIPDAVILGPADQRWTCSTLRSYPWPLTSQDRRIQVSPDARTAWFDEFLRHPQLPLQRGSGVLLRVKRAWKIAQYHLTIPAAFVIQTHRP